MSDVIARLRDMVDQDVNEPLDQLLEEAADEIERLMLALYDVMDARNDPYVVARDALGLVGQSKPQETAGE